MRDRLRQPDALAHSFAVGRNFAIRRVKQTDAFERSDRQLVRLLSVETVDQQKRLDELAAGQPARKRIELRAVTDFAKQLLRLIGGNAENVIVPRVGRSSPVIRFINVDFPAPFGPTRLVMPGAI